MKKAKSLAVLTASALVALTALSGCGGTKDTAEKSTGGEYDFSANSKITVFQSKVEIVDQLESLAEVYKKETGAEVEVWGASGDGYLQQVKTKLTGNQGPSVFSLAPGAETEQLKTYLYDMTNEEYVKNIAPDMELKADGKTVGVPYGVEGYGMIYNKDLVKPEDVTDLDSFTKTLEKFKADEKSGLGLSQESYFLIAHILNTPFALQDDPLGFVEKANKGEVKLADTKEFQEWAKFMDAIKANTKNPLETKYDDNIGDFATGNTAMIHQGNWAYTMFEDYKEDMDFEMGMAALPLEGNKKLSVSVPNYWVINVQKEETEVKAANDFLKWLLNSKTGMDYIVNEFGFLPAMTNIEASSNIDPLSKAVLDATNSGETLAWTFSSWPAGIVDNDLAPATQEYFTDPAMTGQQLLESLDAAWAKATK